jgi:hypothetical protein
MTTIRNSAFDSPPALPYWFALLCSILVSPAPDCAAGDPPLVAGLRGSKIWNYTPNYWSNVADSMGRSFTAPAAPAAVWIVTFYGGNGDIYATFPSGGAQIPHVSFTSTDYNENFLTEFDRRGIRVWLQVEPGAAPMTDLVDIVLNRYKHHPCVIGFGVDVEWLDTQSFPGGRRATDVEASAWEAKVRSHDSSYTLFLKHYSPNRMPPAYRGNILFVDDSQRFSGLSSCINEFKAWGATFSPSKVAFQFGYPDDRPWWSTLKNPPATIGNAILANVPNTSGLFWVDFTITEVFPISTLAVAAPGARQEAPLLRQNFPNPFNPTTNIKFRIAEFDMARLEVYDVLGREVAVLINEKKPPGEYEITYDASGQAGGIYLYRLTTGSFVQTGRMILVK